MEFKAPKTSRGSSTSLYLCQFQLAKDTAYYATDEPSCQSHLGETWRLLYNRWERERRKHVASQHSTAWTV